MDADTVEAIKRISRGGIIDLQTASFCCPMKNTSSCVHSFGTYCQGCVRTRCEERTEACDCCTQSKRMQAVGWFISVELRQGGQELPNNQV